MPARTTSDSEKTAGTTCTNSHSLNEILMGVMLYSDRAHILRILESSSDQDVQSSELRRYLFGIRNKLYQFGICYYQLSWRLVYHYRQDCDGVTYILSS